MKPQDLERLREMLLQMKAESEDDARSSRDATRPVELDQTTVGRLSRMDAMQQQQMAQESARRREHLLQRIDGALRRMDADDYGYCAACGEPIAPGRLFADPCATRCIKCADQR
ncbi:TraR/DksA family transcriptional regulator [Immundisolibacter sp.]|jgi:DnaK suppressor protein